MNEKFDLKEFTKSEAAHKHNYMEQYYPPDEVIDNLMVLHRDLLVPLMKSLPGELKVNSGYRCERVNIKVGGKPKSQHKRGMAADVEYWEDGKEMNKVIVDKVKELGLEFDQMINEGGWIHLSYNQGNNRKMSFNL